MTTDATQLKLPAITVVAMIAGIVPAAIAWGMTQSEISHISDEIKEIKSANMHERVAVIEAQLGSIKTEIARLVTQVDDSGSIMRDVREMIRGWNQP